MSTFQNTGGKNVYVSPTGLSANDGLSESTPCQSLLKAYQIAANNDTIIMLDGLYYRGASWQNQRIQKNLNIKAKNKGKVKVIYGDVLTYTKTAGATNVYQVARSSVSKVVDISFDDIGTEYLVATSIADCDAKEGSWYTDGTTLYVHAIGHGSPDNNKVFALLKGEHFWANSDTQAVSLYLEGFTIYGGFTGNLTVDETNNPISVYAKSMIFLYGSADSGKADAVNISGATYAFFQDCIAAYSDKDGFNYTAYNDAGVLKDKPKFIEVNCQGFSNGLLNRIAGSENTNNGSTAHEGAVGIRINGKYFNNMGSNVCDVQVGTRSVNLGCMAFDSACTLDSSFATDFCTQQSGAEMWLDGCVSFGSRYNIYPTSGTTMHVYNTEFDTMQGGGTLDLINQL
ncbi:hypothetical protein SAMN05444673_6359 [Bacillus sp. OV166]|uniref:hypothetical protein n=1 Tax=Bacillus sp. OV166 TaxID=1882763 RepID=UPI000A2ADC48|nr:hypothetical protein [Bacillus sp. OV166]SMQ85055.1 hypothetical protein SAMN05444673_6359 [Bacillus sp. OV166]